MIRRPPRSTPLSLHDALPIYDVLDLLGRLVEQSLVVVELTGTESRYRMLEPIRAYAQEQMEAAGEEARSEEHTSELQSRQYLVCRLLLEKKKTYDTQHPLLVI